MFVLTGGAGFIGSCLLKQLNDEGIKDIILVDNLGSSPKWKNLVGKRFYRYYNKHEFFDIINGNRNFANQIDTIIHFGACSKTTETDVDYVFNNNLNYSIELASFAADRDIRFIYASSASIYGDGSKGYSDMHSLDYQPLNPYGLSKFLFDQWIDDNQLHEVFTGIRFFNVFGPNEYHKNDMSSMIFKAYHQVKEKGTISLFKSNSPQFGDGEQKRDFIYIKDCINVLMNIISDSTVKGIYNLGTGKARTWNDLARIVFKTLNADERIEYIEMPDSIAKQYQNFTQAETEKIMKTGTVKSFTELEDSCQDYINNYLEIGLKYI